MKGCFILLGLIGAAIAVNLYATELNDAEVDKFLGNDRVFSNYIRCVLEKGPCTAEGRELKRILPDALASDCSKCNKKQLEIADRVIEHLIVKRPADWDLLTAKFDPDGHYKKKYDAMQAAKKAERKKTEE